MILHDGLRRMYVEQENIYYYITVMNENYTHPDKPEGCEEGILKGMYLLQDGGGSKKKKQRVQLLGSGTILREVIAGAELLEKDFGVSADVWSCPSFNELSRDGIDVDRWNMLHPTEDQKVSYVTQCLSGRPGPVIAATDYMRAFPDQIRPFVPAHYVTLGTDGYGRSDTRAQLRKFFEVNRYYVAVASLKALADEGTVPASRVADAIKKYKIDPEKPNPVRV